VIDTTAILKGLGSAAAAVSALKPLIKSSKGIKRGLLMELQGNIGLIALHLRGEAPIDKVIGKLEVSRCKAALESDFNFATLKRGRVGKAMAQGVPQYRPYVGWSTEQLFANIYLKIRELQNIVEIDAANEKFRKRVRLINVFKLMLLLLRHINS
jgi:hypothetical protein